MSKNCGEDSKIKISNALATLLEEKNLEDMTAGEVIALAGVGKSTFYRHYHDIYDVFEEMTDGFANRVVGVMLKLVFSGAVKEYIECERVISFDSAMNMFGLENSDKVLVDYLFRTQSMKTFHLVVARFREVVKNYSHETGIDVEQADFYTRFVMNGVLYSSLNSYRESGTLNMELIKFLNCFNIVDAQM